MSFDVNMWINILLAILFLGFCVLCSLSIRALVRQKHILIPSLLSRQSGLIEVVDVNAALLVIVILVIRRLYLYIPVVSVFALFVLTTTRLHSGIGNDGIYIGMTFIPWNQISGYLLMNDDINTILLKFRTGNRFYIVRCRKQHRGDIHAILRKHHIRQLQMKQKLPPDA